MLTLKFKPIIAIIGPLRFSTSHTCEKNHGMAWYGMAWWWMNEK
jgi:hypothetical protein